MQAALLAEKRAQRYAMCEVMAQQIVSVALKAAEYRESRGCNAPLREWRQWNAMFIADSRELDPPVDPAAARGSGADEADAAVNKAAVDDFLKCCGPWAVEPAIPHNTEVAKVVADVANAARHVDNEVRAGATPLTA